MVYQGSKMQALIIGFVVSFLICFLLFGIIAYLANSKIPIHMLVILPLASSIGSSLSLSDTWNISIMESSVDGPMRKNFKIVKTQINYEDITKIRKGIPGLLHTYIKSRNGDKILLIWPYFSSKIINEIIEAINQNITRQSSRSLRSG